MCVCSSHDRRPRLLTLSCRRRTCSRSARASSRGRTTRVSSIYGRSRSFVSLLFDVSPLTVVLPRGVTPETPATSNTIGSQSESVRAQLSGGLPSRAPIESNINAAEWTPSASSPRTRLTSLDHSCSAISSSSSQRPGADFVEPLSSQQHSSYATSPHSSSPLACNSSYYAYGEHRPPPLHPASPNGYPADEDVLSNLMQQVHVSQSNASAPQYTEPQHYGQSVSAHLRT